MELTRGTIVGQYRVDRVLGQGGMAVVYSVTHELLGSQHALKLLTTTQRTVRERLLREGRVQAALRHPNVVGVTDVVLVGGSPGLVMEFVDGPTLATLLVHTRLTVGQSVVLMRAVLGGVAAAHRMGVIHRDLKPANVLVEVVDGVVVPRVADFGLVKALDSDRATTRTGATMGTPAYMAPEQIRDASRADVRSDVFSLGAILYELVTGVRAFPGDSIVDLFAKISAGDWVHPSVLVPDLPPALVDAIVGALRPSAAERIASCGELLDLLDRVDVSADPSVAALPALVREVAAAAGAEPSEATWTPAEPGPTVGPAALTVTTDGTSSLVAVSSAPPAPVASRRGAWWGAGALVLLVVVGVGAAGVWWSERQPPAPPVAAAARAPAPVAAPKVAEVAPPPPAPPPEPSPEPTPAEASVAAPAASAAPAAPVAAAVAPVAEAAPAPVGTAPATAMAQVTVEGDAERVVFVSSSGTFGPGAVPPGSYAVRATYAGRGQVEAASITLVDGQSLVLRCSSTFTVCRPVAP